MQNSFHKAYLIFTPFVTGAIIMILEVMGFRLFAPYFGYSVYVWGSLLGIIMVALAFGYYVGGMVADKYGKSQILYMGILISALYVLVIYFLFPSVAKNLVRLDIIQATLLASVFVFGVPMFILSMVSPFVIGVQAKMGHVGQMAGSIYGLSTAGSILGTFLASFYLVPEYGTKTTLIISFISLLVLSVGGLCFWKKQTAALLVLVFIINFVPSDGKVLYLSEGSKLLEDIESRYTRIIVYENKNNNITLLSEFLTTQAQKKKGSLVTGRIWDYFNLSPMINPSIKDYLMLGDSVGIGTTQINHFFPDINIDAVEIDEQVIELGPKYFGSKNSEKIKRYSQDARPFIEYSDKKYDAITLDLYSGGLTAPFYIATQEFYEAVKDHLNPGGHVTMNLVDPSREKKLAAAMLNTLSSVFPYVYKIKVSYLADLVLAFPEEMTMNSIKDALNQNTNFELEHVVMKGLMTLESVSFNKALPVFTDDVSQIEELSYQSIMEFRRRKIEAMDKKAEKKKVS